MQGCLISAIFVERLFRKEHRHRHTKNVHWRRWFIANDPLKISMDIVNGSFAMNTDDGMEGKGGGGIPLYVQNEEEVLDTGYV